MHYFLPLLVSCDNKSNVYWTIRRKPSFMTSIVCFRHPCSQDLYLLCLPFLYRACRETCLGIDHLVKCRVLIWHWLGLIRTKCVLCRNFFEWQTCRDEQSANNSPLSFLCKFHTGNSLWTSTFPGKEIVSTALHVEQRSSSLSPNLASCHPESMIWGGQISIQYVS